MSWWNEWLERRDSWSAENNKFKVDEKKRHLNTKFLWAKSNISKRKKKHRFHGNCTMDSSINIFAIFRFSNYQQPFFMLRERSQYISVVSKLLEQALSWLPDFIPSPTPHKHIQLFICNEIYWRFYNNFKFGQLRIAIVIFFDDQLNCKSTLLR